MATIVTQYNPWREQALLGLGVNLLSDALQRGREADNNRKMNALIQKSMSEANAAAGQYAGQDLLTGQPLPQDYNSDGWAKTMHDSYTPMTQFDLGTDAAMGRLSTPRIPTQMEYLNALLGNLDSERFGGVNTKDAYAAFAPVIEAGEKAQAAQLAEQQRKMQQQFANALSLMETRDEYGRALNTYLASGYAPKDATNAMQKIYEHLFPDYKNGSFDTGGSILPYAFNPGTGDYNYQTDKDGNLLNIPKSATPDQLLKTGYDYDKLKYDYYQQDQDNQFKYWDAEQKYGQQGQGHFLTAQKQIMEQLDKEETAILAEIEDLQGQMDAADKDKQALIEPQKIEAEARLNNLRQRKQAIQTELMYRGGFAQRPQWQVGQGVSPMVQGHRDTILKWAQHYGVDPDLIAAIMQVESGGNPNMNGDGTTISKAGARGVMQIMPETARSLVNNYGLDPKILNKLDDTDTSVMLGTLLLSELQRQYGMGDLDAILGAYNGGSKGANAKTRVPETKNYIAKGNSVYRRLKGTPPPKMTPLGEQTQQAKQKTTEQDNSPVIFNSKGKGELTENQLNRLIEEGKKEGISPEQTLKDIEATGEYEPDRLRLRMFQIKEGFSPEQKNMNRQETTPQYTPELQYTPEQLAKLHQATINGIKNNQGIYSSPSLLQNNSNDVLFGNNIPQNEIDNRILQLFNFYKQKDNDPLFGRR